VGMEGRDGTIQCVSPRIIQAELACYIGTCLGFWIASHSWMRFKKLDINER